MDLVLEMKVSSDIFLWHRSDGVSHPEALLRCVTVRHAVQCPYFICISWFSLRTKQEQVKYELVKVIRTESVQTQRALQHGAPRSYYPRTGALCGTNCELDPGLFLICSIHYQHTGILFKYAKLLYESNYDTSNDISKIITLQCLLYLLINQGCI
jgi:hypothetical protein